MSVIQIPKLPFNSMKVNYQSNSLDLKSPQGGVTQRATRLGDRFSLTISPAKLNAVQGQRVAGLIMQGSGKRIRAYVPQQLTPAPVTFNPVFDHMPVVGGVTNTGGTSVYVKTGTPNYKAYDGQFFSIFHGGAYYLHYMTSGISTDAFGQPYTAFDGSGNALLNLWPMLRFQPVAGDLFVFDNPIIEGYAPINYSYSMSFTTAIQNEVTITEAA